MGDPGTDGRLSGAGDLSGKRRSSLFPAASCTTLPLWRQLHNAIRHCLEGITLADLAAGKPLPGELDSKEGEAKA